VSTIQERLASLDGHQGHEEEAEVVIHPLDDGLLQPAPRAAPRCGVDGPCSGLNAGDKEKHALFPCWIIIDRLYYDDPIGFGQAMEDTPSHRDTQTGGFSSMIEADP